MKEYNEAIEMVINENGVAEVAETATKSGLSKFVKGGLITGGIVLVGAAVYAGVKFFTNRKAKKAAIRAQETYPIDAE